MAPCVSPAYMANAMLPGREELVDLLSQRHRQAHAAIFGRRRHADIAALAHLPERLGKSLGRGDAAVVVAHAAFKVARSG